MIHKNENPFQDLSAQVSLLNYCYPRYSIFTLHLYRSSLYCLKYKEIELLMTRLLIVLVAYKANPSKISLAPLSPSKL